MILPSKELLSEVLKQEVTYLSDRLDNNLLPYQVANQEGWNTVNIHELAHLCKKWTLSFRFDNNPESNRYYKQRSGYEDKFNVETKKQEVLGYMTLTWGCLGHCKIFYANTEPEAIFLACEWVLEETKR